MFLPMSWISPLTVATKILPLLSCASPLWSMWALIASNEFLTVSALIISWGRNIVPFSNSRPTTLSASTSMLLIMSIGSVVSSWRTVSSNDWSLRPFMIISKSGLTFSAFSSAWFSFVTVVCDFVPAYLLTYSWQSAS